MQKMKINKKQKQLKCLNDMKSYFEQNYILKDRYSDLKRTKNHPKTCEKAHSFCNLQYEWSDEFKNNKIMIPPINSSIPNIILPKSRQRSITVNYDGITQQDLDDWVAQSMNRNLTSLLNPQKKFHIPAQLEDDMRTRYRKKSTLIKAEEDVYFTQKKNRKKTNYYGTNKKSKLQLSDLCFNYNKLEVKKNQGSPIKIRQLRNKKRQIIRRNAVFLDKDSNYNRLVKELSRIKQKSQIKKQQPILITQIEPMFYSFNIQSLKRKSAQQQTPCSITQHEFERLKQSHKDYLNSKKGRIIDEQKQHQNFRQKVVQNTKNASKKISDSIVTLNKKKQYTQKPQNKQIVKFRAKISSNYLKNPTLSTKSVDKKSIGKDKVLEEKVLALLNDMQILAENIDDQMSELNIHVTQVMLKNVDARPQMKWALKGQQKLVAGHIQLAIDCYKQALIIQTQFYIPTFNIAALLQKQKMYIQAKKWFQVCDVFDIDEQNVKFGLALVSLKQLNFDECTQYIDEIIKKYETLKKQPKLVYYYMRALCNKKLRKFDQARQDYNIISKNNISSNYNYLSNYVFSMVFSKIRRLRLNFDGLSYLNFRQTLMLVNHDMGQRIRIQNQPLQNIAHKLVNSAFFKRFSISLIQKLLQSSKYETVKADSLIFISQQETAIILSGLVVIRNHLYDFSRPQTTAVLQLGGIIGGGKIDNFTNEKSNKWFLTKTDVQLIRIERKHFYQFWKGQITFDFDFKYNFIKNVGLFKKLPDSTLFNICERIQKVQFNKNTILFNDCSYKNMNINKKGVGFGLGKTANSTDPRFINTKKLIYQQRKKGKYRLCQIMKKNIFKINEMKFTTLKYPGLFILIKGKIQVEDDQGFRCQDLICQRQYFGENLLIDSDGFQKYGRMVVISEKAQLYFLPIDNLMWAFTFDDKKTMKSNTKNRGSIQTIKFLRNRFIQCQPTRINYHYLLNGKYNN